jgi:hypothetical protein
MSILGRTQAPALPGSAAVTRCPGCGATDNLGPLRLANGDTVKACVDFRGCCQRARAAGAWCR